MDVISTVPNFDDTLDEVFWGELNEKERRIIENDSKQLMIASFRADESLDDIQEEDEDELEFSKRFSMCSNAKQLYDIEEYDEECDENDSKQLMICSFRSDETLNDLQEEEEVESSKQLNITYDLLDIEENDECVENDSKQLIASFRADESLDGIQEKHEADSSKQLSMYSNTKEVYDIEENEEQCVKNDSKQMMISSFRADDSLNDIQEEEETESSKQLNMSSSSFELYDFEENDKQCVKNDSIQSMIALFIANETLKENYFSPTEQSVNFDSFNSTKRSIKSKIGRRTGTPLIHNMSSVTKRKRLETNLLSPFVCSNSEQSLMFTKNQEKRDSLNDIQEEEDVDSSKQWNMCSNTKELYDIKENKECVKNDSKQLIASLRADETLHNIQEEKEVVSNKQLSMNSSRNKELYDFEENDEQCVKNYSKQSIISSFIANESLNDIQEKEEVDSNKQLNMSSNTKELYDIKEYEKECIKNDSKQSMIASFRANESLKENHFSPTEQSVNFDSFNSTKRSIKSKIGRRTGTPLIRNMSSVTKRKRLETNLLSPFVCSNSEQTLMSTKNQENDIQEEEEVESTKQLNMSSNTKELYDIEEKCVKNDSKQLIASFRANETLNDIQEEEQVESNKQLNISSSTYDLYDIKEYEKECIKNDSKQSIASFRANESLKENHFSPTKQLINSDSFNSTKRSIKSKIGRRTGTPLIHNMSSVTKRKRIETNLLSPFVCSNTEQTLMSFRADESLDDILEKDEADSSKQLSICLNTKELYDIEENKEQCVKNDSKQLMASFRTDETLNNIQEEEVVESSKQLNMSWSTYELYEFEVNEKRCLKNDSKQSMIASFRANESINNIREEEEPESSKQLSMSSKTKELYDLEVNEKECIKNDSKQSMIASFKANESLKENHSSPTEQLINFDSFNSTKRSIKSKIGRRIGTPLIHNMSSVTKKKRLQTNMLSPFVCSNTEQTLMFTKNQEKRDSSLGLLNNSLINFSVTLNDDEIGSNTQNQMFLNPN